MSASLEALQWALCGAALRQPQGFGQLAALLSPEDFPATIPEAMWSAMCSLHFAGRPIDRLTLKLELGDDEAWPLAFDQAESSACSDPVYYAQLLQEQLRLDRLKAKGTALGFAENLEEADKLLAELNRVSAGRSRADVTSAANAAQEFFDRMESRRKPDYLKTGIDGLDRRLYLELGDFVVIGGYPKAGKTLIGTQMARKLAERYRVGYFFLESSKEKLMDRAMSAMSRVPMGKIKRRDLNEAEWKALNDAGRRFSALQLDIINAAGMSVQDIQAVSLNKRYQVVFVDYLQLLAAPGKGLYEQVTNISKGLHVMGRQHGIAVFALAQLSRPEKSGAKPAPPNLSSFRESGQIEQDADAAMLLYPSDPKDNRSHRILNLAKNKEGESCRLYMEFDGAIQSMREIPEPATTLLRRELGEVNKRLKAEAKAEQVTFENLPGGSDDIPF